LTARVISRDISEGVVAPAFDETAMHILAKKRNGNFTVLKIDPEMLPSKSEERTIFGLRLRHKETEASIDEGAFDNIVSASKHTLQLPKEVRNDLAVAFAAVKFMQANSVCLAYRGQVIYKF
uniref:TH1 domain-containing protein n=1 Tax=Gongylonema pulchrum TaxID=637853 RepID=A0A183DWT6_9BILA